jgi:hypothetical protein
MEVFLYKCEHCGAAMFSNTNNGSIYYVVYCAGCKLGSFFEKVEIKGMDDVFGLFKGYRFEIEEKMNVSSKTDLSIDKKE